MELGPHAAFIIVAYGASVLIIASLIVWIVADYRTQLRVLADLERRGVTRRSAREREKLA